MTGDERRAELERLLELHDATTHYAAAQLLTERLRPWLDDGAEIDDTTVRRWRNGQSARPLVLALVIAALQA